MIFPGERKSTEVTFKGTLTRVSSFMNRHVVLLHKRLVAHVTHKWLFLGVHTFVPFQLIDAGKCFAARLALMRHQRRMYHVMHVGIRLLRKGLQTLFAVQRILRMRPHMPSEINITEERTIAKTTDVWSMIGRLLLLLI